MKCFITGANGFIGIRLTEKLSAEGHSIKCLVRSPEKFQSLSHFQSVSALIGDLDNLDILDEGVKDCDTVFHMAAFAKPWSRDQTLPYRVNVQGTQNILKASLKAGVRRFVFTSSAAVIGPSPDEKPIDESFNRTVPFFNEYEETKSEAEKLVKEYSGNGMATVIVNPTRVFGQGPINESNSITKMIKLYNRGRWRILPGNGKCVGNYAFVDDVVNGHILAAQKGGDGERYLLGGENLTFNGFFDVLAAATGNRRVLIPFPVKLMVAIAAIMEWQAKFTNIAPVITVPWVKKYLNHWSLSSNKAVQELGYRITPFEQGVDITLGWIKSKKTRNE